MKNKIVLNALIVVLVIGAATNANATWSIIAVDRNTGEIGIAGASCTFDVQGIASIVPGKGAIVVQAASNYFARMKGVDLMEKGATPEAIVKAMRHEKFEPEKQQYGVLLLAKNTKPLVHSGRMIKNWSGSKSGVDFAILGNVLVGQNVIENAFVNYNTMRNRPLGARLMSALTTGESAGGDRRCGDQYARSAFISVYQPTQGAILKLAVYGIEKGGVPAVTMLNQRFKALE